MTSALRTLRDFYDAVIRACSRADFLAPLLLRLYLAPIFWMAGWNKAMSFEDTVGWFGADGLGLPLPGLMAALATGTELIGAVLLLTGLATR
ncbi:MAG: DoxX family protein, partial [Panacagrimonas sp.]